MPATVSPYDVITDIARHYAHQTYAAGVPEHWDVDEFDDRAWPPAFAEALDACTSLPADKISAAVHEEIAAVWRALRND